MPDKIMHSKSIKQRIVVLGNNFFPELSELYEVRHITQTDIVASIGVFGDIEDYFRCINFQPDLLFISDDSLPLLYCGLEKLDIPLVGYLIDSHLHFNWHTHFAHVFDYCFIAQENCFLAIRKNFQNCRWLPLFALSNLFLDLPRDIDVCFVGTIDPAKNPERVRFIEEFRRRHPLTVAHGSYQELFNRSRIILNQSVLDDINFRVYEGMACGGMLLTDSVGNGMEKLFGNGLHLVTYEKGNVDDAVRTTIYYLAHEQERHNIALAGHMETVTKHTSFSRVLTIHKIFQKLLAEHNIEKNSRIDPLIKTFTVLSSRYKSKIADRQLSESYNSIINRLTC